MKKLYEVDFIIRTVVLAYDSKDAYTVASDSFKDIARDSEPDIDVGAELLEGQRLPPGWDADCYPYGRGWEEDELTIKQIWEGQAREPVSQHLDDDHTYENLE